MKKIWLLALMLIPLALVSTGCGREKKQLTIFTWDEMFPPEILEGFEKETGIKINYVNFDLNETMLTRLEASGGGDYDLIIADDYIIETAIAEGLAQKLNRGKITNYRGINPVYQQQFYDPNNEYTVPYGAGVQTIVYDPAQISLDIKGYAGLWDSSLRGKLGIIENYRVINGMALKVLGKSYNIEEIDSISAAGEKLLALAPNIRLIRDDYLQDELLSGEIAAAVLYTPDVTRAKLENPGLKVVFPEEGTSLGTIAAFIPAKAPNPDAAHAFINYILDPQRGASCFEYLGYYSTCSASDPLISAEYKDSLTLPEGFTVGMETIRNIGEAADDEHARIWTAFKEAAGK